MNVKNRFYRLIRGLLAVCVMCALADAGVQGAEMQIGENDSVVRSTADHAKFKILDQDFKTGPDVTRACLTCHTQAALQVHKTFHWTWESEKGIQKGIGKKNVLNNF
ncbi:MAG TPA: hypothetical protein EYP57_07620 [Thermodesulfobacteriaceae bacterium]|nr:hypothetical protein [Thermodesulfobacteriaceae bacterium]